MSQTHSPSMSPLPSAQGFDLVPILWKELKNEYPELEHEIKKDELLTPEEIDRLHDLTAISIDLQNNKQFFSLLHKIRKLQLKQLEDKAAKEHRNKLFFYFETLFASFESGGVTDTVVTVTLKAFHFMSATGNFTIALMEGVGGAVVYTFKGILGLAEVAKVACDNTIKQRKTRYGTALASTALSGIAIAIFAGAFTVPPATIPFILLGIIGMGFYKELYILKQNKNKLKKQEGLLEKTEQQLIHVVSQQKQNTLTNTQKAFLDQDPKIIRLTYELAHLKQQAAVTTFNIEQMTTRSKVRVVALAGTAILITSAVLLLPQLTIFGAVTMLSTGLANIHYKIKERRALKEITSKAPKEERDYQRVLDKISLSNFKLKNPLRISRRNSLSVLSSTTKTLNDPNYESDFSRSSTRIFSAPASSLHSPEHKSTGLPRKRRSSI